MFDSFFKKYGKREEAKVSTPAFQTKAPPLQKTTPTNSQEQNLNIFTPEYFKSEDAKKYDWTQTYTFLLPNGYGGPLNSQNLDDPDSLEDFFDIDDRFIDVDMLLTEDGKEADRIYLELKERAIRKRKHEIKEAALRNAMLNTNAEEMEMYENESEDSDDRFGETRSASDSMERIKNDQAARILKVLEDSTTTEKLDFTNGLLAFADTMQQKNVDLLLPLLQMLARDTIEIKKSLLNQFKALVQLVQEKFGDESYTKVFNCIWPLLDKLLYDTAEEVRDRAVQVVGELRKVVREDDKEHIMKLTLDLAHEETSERCREAAVKLLNELAPDMGQQLCEYFIVHEFCSLGYDPKGIVRCAVAKNLVSISKCVGHECFRKKIFPLYKDLLTKDKEERVRKTCAEVVADFARVSPLKSAAADLQNCYFGFLQDTTSRLVRGTAFQNIGPFVACFKDVAPIDARIQNFFINTTEKTTNRDVCYYASYNFPAFVYVSGAPDWPRFRKLYQKLCSSQDVATKKTLACSLHELARILGRTITTDDLAEILDRFLGDNHPEVRLGALKNLHIFLVEVNSEDRQKYVKFILQTLAQSGKDWRTKVLIAKNLGAYISLFSEEVVRKDLLEIFFEFCEERYVQVSEAAAHGLAQVLLKFKNQPQLQDIVQRVKRTFKDGPYKRRQLYIIMCTSVMNCLELKDLFEVEFKADMLRLVGDRVPNVRLCLARAIRDHFKQIGGAFVYDRKVHKAVTLLSKDTDRDVGHIVQEILSLQQGIVDSDSESSKTSSSNPLLNSEEGSSGVERFIDSLQQPSSSDTQEINRSIADEINKAAEAQVDLDGPQLLSFSNKEETTEVTTTQAPDTNAEQVSLSPVEPTIEESKELVAQTPQQVQQPITNDEGFSASHESPSSAAEEQEKILSEEEELFTGLDKNEEEAEEPEAKKAEEPEATAAEEETGDKQTTDEVDGETGV